MNNQKRKLKKKILGKTFKIIKFTTSTTSKNGNISAYNFWTIWRYLWSFKRKKSVIVNLEYVNKDIARRIIDVVSGAVHALDGHMQKVSNSIFLIAPYNYDITTEMAREEIKNKLSVSWLKNNMPND